MSADRIERTRSALYHVTCKIAFVSLGWFFSALMASVVGRTFRRQWLWAALAILASIPLFDLYLRLKKLHMCQLYKVTIEKIVDDKTGPYEATMTNGIRMFFWRGVIS